MYLFRSAIVASLVLLVAVTAFVAFAGDTPPDIAALVARVEQDRIRAHIDAIDEPRNVVEQPAQLAATADYVDETLASYGLAVQRQEVRFESRRSPNVFADLAGTQCPERIFVVGAHYDSVATTPGADDDATGTAGMLEIARVLAETPLPATVRFVGFTLEEEGLFGSRAMAEALGAEDAEVVGMYSLEMIAFTDPATSSEFILVLGNEASAPLLAAVERAKPLVPSLPVVTLTAAGNGETSPDTRRSDHAPFWDAGYQALLVTDTANFRNPNYHEPTDTLDTLNLPFATDVTRVMLAATVDYLTHDANSDGKADVCAGPLTATATSVAAAPSSTVPAPTQTVAAPTRSSIVPPATGSSGDNDGEASVIRWVIAPGMAAVGVGIGAAVRLRRRRS